MIADMDTLLEHESPWSMRGNRHWHTRVAVESIGQVEVITCRPWVNGKGQSDYYQTSLHWDKPIREPEMGSDGVLDDYVSAVVHAYKDENDAELGHELWRNAETIAATLDAIRRGVWEMVGKQWVQ